MQPKGFPGVCGSLRLPLRPSSQGLDGTALPINSKYNLYVKSSLS